MPSLINRKRYCIVIILIMTQAIIFAQLNTAYNLYDSNFYAAKDKPALKNFLYHLNYFPPIPKNKFEFGVQIGGLTVNGDVSPILTPLCVSLHLRKALGYVVSLRGQYTFGIAKGKNTNLSSVLPIDSAYNRYATTNQLVYRNYQTVINQFNFQAVFNLTNIDFTQLEKKYNVYVFFGAGCLLYKTKIDALKGAELYNFNAFNPDTDFDNDYETQFKPNNNFIFNVNTGFGFQYKFSGNMSLQAEYQMSLTNTNQIDGSVDKQGSRSMFENNILNNFSVGINYYVGQKKSAPALYWLNPMMYLYKEINSPRIVKTPQPKLIDTDDDGVADLLDREPATIAGVPVDAKGITLDTDGDGVPDFRDQELITPSSCLPANDQGFGNCPNNKNFQKNSCCTDVLAQLNSIKQNITITAIPEKGVTKKATQPAETEAPMSAIETPNDSTNPFCINANLIKSLSDKILFIHNSEKITDESINILNNIVELIKRNNHFSVHVQGNYHLYEHPDSLEYLFNQRREFLVNYLYSNGIPENKMKIKNIEDYNSKESLIELENKDNIVCNTMLNNKCNNKEQTNNKIDAKFIEPNKTINKLNYKIHFKPNDVNLKNFTADIIDTLYQIIQKYPECIVVISAPFESNLYSKELSKETQMSLDRGEVIRQIFLNKYDKPNSIVNVPVNSAQPLGTIPTLRILTNKNVDNDNDCVPDISDKCPLIKGYAEYEGCLTSTTLSDSFMLIAKNILFDFDKDIIKPSSFNYLNLLAQIISKKKYFITIAGKTDDIGDYNHNLTLSYLRAMSVKKYLINKGVAEKNLQAVGLGEQEAIKGTDEERAFNRRVDFWINGVE